MEKAPKKDKKKKEESAPAAPKYVGDYQVYESIGKGAFGVVYRAVHSSNGSTVAIKTFSAASLPQEELRSIEGEVNLMQKLDHPNIVKYIDTVRTPETLNIIIEFVEKGSLSSLRKKNDGPLPESLIALYTAQVLEGLGYLHEQGVVHRDIKGANILLAKDNVIKLADFGVATQLDPSRKELSVVGTPYWMAPEVIEMSGGASTACDIWSLGCTVIELIQGEPPYFSLDPMPALFRIVQDDHPPLPPGISQLLEEFLLACFQKDPNLRAKAPSLIKHRWIQLNIQKPVELLENDVKNEIRNNEVASVLMGTVKIGKNQTGTIAPDKTGDLLSGFLKNNKAEDIKRVTRTISDKKVTQANEKFPDELNVSDEDDDDGAKSPPPKIVDLKKYQDDEEDDAAPIFAKVDLSALNRSKTMGNQKEEDPFEAMGFDDKDLQVDKDLKIQEEISRLISDLIPNPTPNEEIIVTRAIEQLRVTFSDPKNIGQINRMISKHGVIPFMEMLGTSKEDLLLATLRLVYELVTKNYSFLQSLCLMGLIPAVDKFVRNYGYNVKMEASKYIKLFCSSESVDEDDKQNFVKRIFIASGGLQSIVALINQKDYATYKSLIIAGVDCIELILKDSSANIRSDLCRLFCKAKIVRPLIEAMVRLDEDQILKKSAEYVKKIVDIIYVLCQSGKSSARTFLAKKSSLRGLKTMLDTRQHAVKVNILKIIQLLAAEVSARDNLQQIQFIPILVNLLDSEHPDIVAQVLPTIVYLFQVNSRRQEEMALSGIIPILQKFIQSNHHAKQIPLDLICYLSQNKVARVELKKYGGIEFYLELLEMPYWRKRALQALATWIADDGVRVEAVLIQNHNLHRLITAFDKADKNDFNDYSLNLQKIVDRSSRVNRALGKSGKFLDHMISKLGEYTNDNVVMRTLLGILKSMLEASDSPRTMGKKKLDDVLGILAKSQAVLVADAASNIIKQFRQRPQ